MSKNNDSNVYRSGPDENREVYKEDFEDLLLLEQTTVLKPRDGYHRCWERESKLNLRFAQGFSAISNQEEYLGTERMSDPSHTSGYIRIPSRDNNDPLVAIEIPNERYARIQAKSQAIADLRDKAMHPQKYKSADELVETETFFKSRIENKNL